MNIRRKLLSTITAVSLAVGLCPGLAFAGNQDLIAASATDGASSLQVQQHVKVQAKKKLTKAQKKKMLAAYKGVLKQAQAGSKAYDDIQLGSDYAVFDMGNDGIPELFVKIADPSWGGTFLIFDFYSGKARYLGYCPLSSGWLYGKSNGKLYRLSGRQGSYGVTPIVKSAGKIDFKFDKSKNFDAKDVNDWDGALNRCNAYIKKLGAKALNTKPVTDYSLLKSKISLA